jgi:hypothetical protein
MLSSDNAKLSLMYYNVMTTTITVTISCSSLKEKQDDHYDQREIRSDSAPCAHGKCNKRVLTKHLEYRLGTCQNTIHGSMISHTF